MLRFLGLTSALVILLLGPVVADEPTGSGVKVLRTLLTDIGAESDDAFNASKERLKLASEAIAPKGLRSILERPDTGLGEMKFDIASHKGLLEVSWSTETPVNGSIDEAEKIAMDGLKSAGLEPTGELPKGGGFESRLKMMQFMSQRLTTFARQTGTAQELVAVGLADRSARPGSQVRVLLQWTASAPFDGPPLTLQEAMDVLPMLKNAPIEPEVLKVTMVAVLGRFETGLQDRQARPQRTARSLFMGNGWHLTTATDIRPEFQEAIAAAGYTVRQEPSDAPEGYESKTWQHDTRGNLVGWSFSFAPRFDRKMLSLHGQPPRVVPGRPR